MNNGIENRQWKDFLLLDFFSSDKGNQNNMATLTVGNIPLVSARKCDNGYKDFVSPNGKKHFHGGILTLNNDGDGGVGIAYYQPYEMLLDTHVTALMPKIELSKHQLLFIAMCIRKQRSRFGHGYSINDNRLRMFRIMLPLTADGKSPDWQFMESYMRQKEQEILEPTIHKLCKRLIINHIIGGGKCLYPRWKTFVIGDLFIAKRPSNSRKEDDYADGKIPFVASSSIDNGVTKFCDPKEGELLDKGVCLSVSPVDGSCYYQPYDFLGRGGAGSSVILLYAKYISLDKYTALFLSKAIAQTTTTKYSYGHMASLDRLKKDKLYLPVKENGTIDFAFMSSFMQDVERDILGTTLKHFKDRLDVNKVKSGG